MNAVKVQYTVQESYAETNKANVANVMKAVRALDNPNFKYSTFVLDDGVTFIHLVMRQGEDTDNLPNSLPEFEAFRTGLMASKPVSPPKPTNLNLVDTGWQIF